MKLRIMERSRCRSVYFLICLVCLIGLSSIRSPPVYGKLDFLLLNGHPWWGPWRPMIEQVVAKGDQPVISDVATSTVLRAVFFQKAIAFIHDRRYVHLDIDTLISMNRGKKKVLPVGALFVLLGTAKNATVGDYTLPETASILNDYSLVDILADAARKMAVMEEKYPYRCLINLHDFTPSWVPVETGHWSTQWADTSWFYEWKGMRGDDMKSLLKADPPQNCTVFY